jgi:Ala-tRNA(Pro) deacylase
MLQLMEGRPADCSGRLEKEIRSYDLLDRLGVRYQRIDHEAAMTMEACVEIDKALDATICKNLLLCNRQCTTFYLLMLPGEKNFRTSVLSKEIGSSRLSFADAKYMEEFLDLKPVSVSILGLMNDKNHRVKAVIDEDVLKEEMFGCHPCVNTSSLRMKTSDLIHVILPAMGVSPVYVKLNGEN